jgi:hypothetical protein
VVTAQLALIQIVRPVLLRRQPAPPALQITLSRTTLAHYAQLQTVQIVLVQLSALLVQKVISLAAESVLLVLVTASLVPVFQPALIVPQVSLA